MNPQRKKVVFSLNILLDEVSSYPVDSHINNYITNLELFSVDMNSCDRGHYFSVRKTYSTRRGSAPKVYKASPITQIFA